MTATEVARGIEVERALDDLPEGWALTTIGQVVDLNPPKPARDMLPPDASVTFVPMAAVEAEAGTIARPEIRRYSEVRSGYTAFREGDVIVAKITPCMENGKAAVARGLENGLGFGSTEFHVLRPTNAVLPEYVFHYVRQESFRRDARNHMAGAVGQLRVPENFLRDAELPMPPLAEQRRIISRVEDLIRHARSARARLERVPTLLKRFRQAVLAAACSGRLTEDWRARHAADRACGLPTASAPGLQGIPGSWSWTRLPDLGELGRGRSRHRPRNARHLYGGPYPFIQTGDVAQSGGRITRHAQTYSETGLAQSKLWPAGTVCITIAANIADSAILTYPACVIRHQL